MKLTAKRKHKLKELATKTGLHITSLPMPRQSPNESFTEVVIRHVFDALCEIEESHEN